MDLSNFRLPHLPKESRIRLLSVILFLFFLFSLLIARFYVIQIIEGKKWATKAIKQHYFIVQEPFKRGVFYGNNTLKKSQETLPVQLVVDLPKYHLYIDPVSIPYALKGEISSILFEKVGNLVIDPDLYYSQFKKKNRSRKLAMWLDEKEHETILAWWQPYAKKHKIAKNALFFVKDYQRSYPYGKLMGQLLHTIQLKKDERTNQALPTGGLELYFNRYLQGKPGKKRLMRSPRHSLETGNVLSYPEDGADVYLTIDPYLQQIAEEEIEKGVIRSESKSGWAVMMDPKTGEILALAQYPFFYPSEYRSFFNDKQLIEHSKVKAVSDANEPASVFKPFTIAIALKANELLTAKGKAPLFHPEEKIATSSGHFPGRSRPIQDTSLHRFLNLDMAMQKSSNIYMSRLAERIVSNLGSQWYRDQLELFGFGKKTGVELPGESAGVVPRIGKMHPNGALEWSISTPFSLAFGHNIQITTMQLARAFSVFANGGYLVEPTLVKKIVKKERDGTTTTLLDHTSSERKAAFPRILDEKTVKRVVRAMRYVTKPGGTAVKADVPGYTEVGKTGTPKKIVGGLYSEKLYCPVFTGFTPIEHPIVLAVVMDEPKYQYIPGIGKNHNGGNCTALVFRETARRALEYLGITPDDPFGYPQGHPSHNLIKTEWMKETRELQEIYRSWNNIPQTQMTRH